MNIKRIIKEEINDFNWVEDGYSGDDNHAINALGKLKKMEELFLSMEEDLKNMNNKVVSKKFGIGKSWGTGVLPQLKMRLSDTQKTLENLTTGFNHGVDWQKIVVSEELGETFTSENQHLEDYVDRMEYEFEIKPNIDGNHPYKVDPKEMGEDYISGNLIWIMDVDPTTDDVKYMYNDADGSYDTSFRLSDLKEVGPDYLKFK
tara:strand:- start:31 stop:639 length:609 start_codon:yes stop_codon:yes gene_type:complete